MTPFPSLCNLLLCFWETVKIWQRSCISLCFCWEITPWAGSLTPVLPLLPSELSLHLQEGPIPDFLENIGHLTNLSPQGGFSNPKKKNKISVQWQWQDVLLFLFCFPVCTEQEVISGSPGKTTLLVILLMFSETLAQYHLLNVGWLGPCIRIKASALVFNLNSPFFNK